MSHIDELIKKHCPNGVEYKPLSKVISKNLGGGTPSKSRDDFWSGDIPWASVGDLSMPGIVVETTRNHISAAGLQGSSTNLIKAGDLLVAVKISPGRMKIAGQDIAINQDLRGLTLKPEMDSRFLTYYFQTLNIVGNGTIVKAITSAFLEKVKVPVPSIEVQREIVRILDTFSQLEAELEAELEARRKQYTFYRDDLLTFTEGDRRIKRIDDLIKMQCPNGIEFRTIQEVAHITRGVRVTKRDLLVDGKYPVVSGGTGYMGYIDDWNRESQTITIAQYGTAGYVKWQVQRFWANDVCFSVIPKEGVIDNRYLYFVLLNKQQYLYEISNRNAVPHSIEREKILSTRIAVPPIEVQREIVRILDTFSKLEAELEAELEARRKQYNFYRDKLLTFQEAA